MKAETIFSIANMLALAGWILLIFVPRWNWTRKIVISGAIPLFALTFWYLHEKFNFPAPTIFVVGFAIIYFGFFNFLFIEAIQGKPFISKKVVGINNPAKDFGAKSYGSSHRS